MNLKRRSLVYMRARSRICGHLIAGGNWNNAENAGAGNWNSNNDTSNSNANISARLELRGILSSSEQRIYQHSLKESNTNLSADSVSILPHKRTLYRVGGAQRDHEPD